jgi:hypothetical protein
MARLGWVRARLGWFRPAPASRLGLLRVVVGVFLLATLLDRRAEVLEIAAGNRSFFHPVGVAVLLTRPLPVATFATLQDVTIALCMAWTLGLAWRVVGPAFAAAFLFWATYRLCWGAIVHDLHVVTLHVLVLAFTPAAAALSLDAAIARRIPRWPAWIPGPTAGSAQYGWPLRALSLVTVLTYLLAGLAKVSTGPAFAWASGDNLLQQIAYTALVHRVYDPGRTAPLAEAVFHAPWAMSVPAVLTLVLEIGAPVALIGGRVRTAWIVGILGMHAGIAALMDITFPYQTYGIALLSFVAIERVLPRRWR